MRYRSNIRLGEYDTANDTDCLDDSKVYECADAVQDFGIERIIVHPGYDKKHRKNNVGLIRLNRKVFYSGNLKPD